MNKKKLIWQLPFLLLLIVGTVLIIRQQQSVPYQKNSGMVFGTVYNLTYQCDSDLNESIKAELQKVDNSLSPFNEQSIITAINQNKEVVPATDRGHRCPPQSGARHRVVPAVCGALLPQLPGPDRGGNPQDVLRGGLRSRPRRPLPV